MVTAILGSPRRSWDPPRFWVKDKWDKFRNSPPVLPVGGPDPRAAFWGKLQVASRIDEAQFRRLQEADGAPRALGLWGRLRAAWRSE